MGVKVQGALVDLELAPAALVLLDEVGVAAADGDEGVGDAFGLGPALERLAVEEPDPDGLRGGVGELEEGANVGEGVHSPDSGRGVAERSGSGDDELRGVLGRAKVERDHEVACAPVSFARLPTPHRPRRTQLEILRRVRDQEIEADVVSLVIGEVVADGQHVDARKGRPRMTAADQ
jgi:hypothetical protein